MVSSYVALLRGINVGGHHKVPMADLRSLLASMGFNGVQTLLNSGNVIFAAEGTNAAALEEQLGRALEERFGFAVPTMVRDGAQISQLVHSDPFAKVTVTDDIRLYLSFPRVEPEACLKTPWVSEDQSYRILGYKDHTIVSVLDLSKANTPKAMEFLEKTFGKDITTRNWKTMVKIAAKLS